MMPRPKLSATHIRQTASALVAVLMIGFVSYLGAHYYNLSKAATPGTIYVSPASATVATNGTLTITVREESGTTPINSAQFFLNYNSSQLQYLSKAEPGDFNFEGPTSTTDPGIIRIQRGMQGSDLTGDHAIVVLNFKMLASSGSTSVTIDKANSLLASGGQNILQTVIGGTYSVPPPTVNKDATLSLTPASGSYAKDATLSITVRINSPTQKVYSVESIITYPTNQLTYLSTTNAPAFPSAPQTANSAGTLTLARGVAAGSTGFIGSDTVATVNFKVIGTSGSIPLSFKNTSGIYDSSGQNLLGSSPGSTYSVATASTPPNTTPTTPAANTNTTTPATSTTKSATVYKPSVSITSGSGGGASSNGSSTQIQGDVQLAPVVNPDILAVHPGDTVKKVEYYLDKELIATKTVPPYTYKLDTEAFKNGIYDLTVKTYYTSGTVDSKHDSISVHNPVTLEYVMVHYGTGIAGTLVGLALIGFIVWKYLMPRFLFNKKELAGAGGYNGYAGLYADHVSPVDTISPTEPADASGLTSPIEPDLAPQVSYTDQAPDTSNEAPEPDVITPTDGPTPSSVISPEQAAATQSTEAIDTPEVRTFAPTTPEPVPAEKDNTIVLPPTTPQPENVVVPRPASAPILPDSNNRPRSLD